MNSQKFFLNYLTLEVANPLAEPTAKKHIKKTKQILGACVNDDLIISNPISAFVCGADETDIAPLELFEVETIYSKENLHERLEQVRISIYSSALRVLLIRTCIIWNPPILLKWEEAANNG